MKKILCFGDSNTYGFIPGSGKRYDKATRWPGVLAALTDGEFEIIEAGCNNRTCFCDNPAGKMQTGYRILPELLSQDLDWVILSIGINDLQFAYNTTPADIKTGLETLIQIIRAKCPTAKILITAPPEITENILTSFFAAMFDKTSIEKSKHLGAIYKAVAQEQNCDFLNPGTVAEVSPIDGLHFSAAAHEKVAHAILKTLRNY